MKRASTQSSIKKPRASPRLNLLEGWIRGLFYRGTNYTVIPALYRQDREKEVCSFYDERIPATPDDQYYNEFKKSPENVKRSIRRKKMT